MYFGYFFLLRNEAIDWSLDLLKDNNLVYKDDEIIQEPQYGSNPFMNQNIQEKKVLIVQIYVNILKEMVKFGFNVNSREKKLNPQTSE